MKRITVSTVLACLLLMGEGTALAFYNAATGRWLNRDPIGESRGIGLFVVCKNAPCNFIDSLGHRAININFGFDNNTSATPDVIHFATQQIDMLRMLIRECMRRHVCVPCQDVRVSAFYDYSSKQKNESPADGDYDPRNDRADADLLARNLLNISTGRDGIPVLLTENTLEGGTAVGIGLSGFAVLDVNGGSPFALGHELGHVAGLGHGDPGDLMAPRGGGLPSAQWCASVCLLAK